MRGVPTFVQRLKAGSGVPEARQQDHRVESLEVAVEENRRLARLLERQVADIEQSLVPLLQADVRAGEP